MSHPRGRCDCTCWFLLHRSRSRDPGIQFCQLCSIENASSPRNVDPFGQRVASGVRSLDRRGPVLRNVISHLAHVIRRTLFRRHGFGRSRERLPQSQCNYFKPKTATDKKTTIWQEQNVYHKYLPAYRPPSTVNFACPSMPAKWSQEASRGSFWNISSASPQSGPRRPPEVRFGRFQAPARQVAPGGLQRIVFEYFRRQPAKSSQEACRESF